MPYLTFTEPAGRDLDRLYRFLSKQSRTAANSAARTLFEELHLLLEQPGLGAVTTQTGIREWKVRFGRGAYLVRYEVRGEERLIVRIRHSREKRL